VVLDLVDRMVSPDLQGQLVSLVDLGLQDRLDLVGNQGLLDRQDR